MLSSNCYIEHELLIPHPEGYIFVSPDEVPEDFVVKCYLESRIVDQILPVEQWQSTIDYWEIDYDLPGKSIAGLVRYTAFKTFEEAAVKCDLLGLKCVKCKWLGYPLVKVGDQWTMSGLAPQGTYIPEEGYDEFAEQFYRDKLGEHYEEWMSMFPAWRPKAMNIKVNI